MAVNSIVFGGVDSADYDIYISGEGVFNAPKRDVEMIEIPGRNGAFALDKGRFENIEVTYPAFNFEPGDYNTFAKNLADFRNAICSLKGYQRLTDSFHPNEYRMAVYRDGLEVKPIKYNTASEFDITFDCKPQRWLTSGETPVTIANSGDTITNPTLFESGPLLEVEGDGNIEFNGYKITINDVPLGEIQTSGKSTDTIAPYLTFSDLPLSYSKQIDYSAFRDAIENGDSLFIDALKITAISTFGYSKEQRTIPGATPSPTITSNIGTASASGAVSNVQKSFLHQNYYDINFTINASISDIELTAFTDEQYTASITAVLKDTSNNTLRTLDITVNINNYNSGLLEIALSFSGTNNIGNGFDFYNGGSIEYSRTYIYSTQSVLGNPLYLDCDLGEAYKIEGGTVISINQHVDLGSKLPTLSPGSNEVTFDNTITDLKITPRWWRV